MLERIALHQTRLQAPGLGVDAKGVALGAKGLVLLASIDRLVTLLAAYTRDRSLEDLMPTLAMHVARSTLGTRQITIQFAADSSDRMDRMAETARLVGGFAFTGTSRHFVQYRDAAAPFGYDATELVATDAAIALYHESFTQTYDFEREVTLRSLVLRLMPHLAASSRVDPGPRIIVAERGVGPALLHYLLRSQVEGEACIAEWPPPSAFDDESVRRWVMRIPAVPERIRPLLHTTPGIVCFVPAGQGVAVEAGYRHPLELQACPVFDAAGLVLLRARGEEPWLIERTPPMGMLSSFARVELRTAGTEASVAHRTFPAEAVRVPLRVTPSAAPRRSVTAAWVAPAQWPLLRRLAYALPYETVARARIATTAQGSFLRSEAGIEGIPLGRFFVEVHPNLFLPAGYEVTPAVSPALLALAIGAPPSHVTFIDVDAHAWGVDSSAFVPLESALLDAPPWDELEAQSVERSLEEAPIDLKVTSVGAWSLLEVDGPPKGPQQQGPTRPTKPTTETG